jgi:hypothetical protein
VTAWIFLENRLVNLPKTVSMYWRAGHEARRRRRTGGGRGLDDWDGRGVVLLKNSRFYAGETKNAPEFSEQLAALADLYVDDAIKFKLTSEDAPGVERTFDTFTEAITENGRSRILLGVHWRFDDPSARGPDVGGRVLGQKIADYIWDNFLKWVV